MAYNTVAMIKDSTGKSIPQYYDPIADAYLPFLGSALSAITTMQNAAAAIGDGTALPTEGFGIAMLAVSGTFEGTIIFEGEGPDGNWYAISAQKKDSGIIAATATSTGLYEVVCRGLSSIRARISAYTSGNITVKGQAQAISSGNPKVDATLKGSVPTKTSIETLINAESVLAGQSSTTVSLGVTDETEVWLLVSIDQQPWSLQTQYPWLESGGSTRGIYPEYSGNTNIFTTASPAVGLLLGMPFGSVNGTEVPANWTEALALAWAWSVGGSNVKVVNASPSTATVSLKAYRVWRQR